MKSYFSDRDPKDYKDRLTFATVIVLLAFFVIAGRLWYLQIKEGGRFEELSENNRVRLVRIEAPRGIIYDRNGKKVVENRPGFNLFIVPEDVHDWEETKKKLSELIDMDYEGLTEKLTSAEGRPRFQPVRIKGDITWEEMARVEASLFELPGVIIGVGPKRLYPHGEAAAHLTGYLGEVNKEELRRRNEGKWKNYISGELIGKYGIELAYEDTLRGIAGAKQVEVDVAGREINVINIVQPYPGSDVHLTIDLETQLAAWEAMEGKAGAVIAIDPESGEVLAIVSTPGFNPNDFTKELTGEEWKRILRDPMKIMTNRALQGQYPPASTFKVVTAAAGLGERAITPEEKIFSGPAFHFKGRDYRDWKESGHGEITVHKAIVESSDTFFYQLGLELGLTPIAKYARNFGFGSATGIDMGGEKSGLVPSNEWKKRRFKERWFDGETISVSVGQGFLLATPLQIATAYSAIANGGTIFRPTLVSRTSTPSGGTISEFSPDRRGYLKFKKEYLNIIKKALRGVTTEETGTARFLGRSPFGIAGKTGTAQVVTLTEREKDLSKIEYRFRDHGLFAGYAPYNDPKIAVAVIVEHGGFGSTSAAPVALKVIEAYLSEDHSKEKSTGGAKRSSIVGTPAETQAGSQADTNNNERGNT